MKKWSAIAVVALIALGVCYLACVSDNHHPQNAPEATSAPGRPPKGFVSLFNGKDLTGWKGQFGSPVSRRKMTPKRRAAAQKKANIEIAKHWRVENDQIVNMGRGPYLATVKDYGDFELLIDYNTVPKADSGIYLRGCPQVQIWDTTRAGGKWGLGADKGSGGLWNNKKHPRFPLAKADRPFGRWNSLRIRMVGRRVTVHLNGRLVVDNVVMENYWERGKPIYATGPIELQTHGGEIRWRNVYIREIPRKAPCTSSTQAATQGR